MINGPTVLRSGVMSTELALNHGDGRVRAIFQHAPAWEKGNEEGIGPPTGLKFLRVLISREALRPLAPSPASEQADPPSPGNPTFFGPVPPFKWYKVRETLN